MEERVWMMESDDRGSWEPGEAADRSHRSDRCKVYTGVWWMGFTEKWGMIQGGFVKEGRMEMDMRLDSGRVVGRRNVRNMRRARLDSRVMGSMMIKDWRRKVRSMSFR